MKLTITGLEPVIQWMAGFNPAMEIWGFSAGCASPEFFAAFCGAY